MSQHTFRTRRGASRLLVTMGYDRPLQYVHLTVLNLDDEDEDIVYSNLDDEQAGIHCCDVNYYRRVLTGLGLTVPESLFAETMRDQVGNIGNRQVEHHLTSE